MLNGNKLRISLALVIFAGAFHLDRAQAAEPSRANTCEVQAALYVPMYASAYCASKGTRPYSVTWACGADGNVVILSVSCLEPT